MQYMVVIERSKDGYGAYVPDLPGCAATAKTEAQVKKLIREGIEIYIEELKIRGKRIPAPRSHSAQIEVRAS